MRFQFSSQCRLRKTSEFQRVYKKGKKVLTAFFILFFIPSTEELQKKLGLTVSTSVGGAVERNRIKRQIKEIFRLNFEKLPFGDYVIKARISSAKISNERLREDLLKGIAKIPQGRKTDE